MFFGRASYLGGYGRGRGGRNTWTPNFNRAQPPPPLKPPGAEIDSINIKTLLVEQEAPKIEDVEYVASYNWLDVKSPVILVPGSPPAWTPPGTDIQLKQDSEDVFRDINSARFASFPMEPCIRSLQLMRPDFEVQSVDIVGCGSTLGNLLRFASSNYRAFRFDVDVIGDTVFFIRKENSPTELIKDLKGHGHTFPEAYTTWDVDVRGSCSHQRIIRYDFGGIQCLVRTETDAYVREAKGDKMSSTTSDDHVSLEDAFATSTITSSEVSCRDALQVKLAGTPVRQDQIFDIKTRANFKPFDMQEILPRIWLNQTPQFLIAYHKHGVFDKPRVQDVRKDVNTWETENSALLARLHSLLTRILDVVRESEKQQCEVYWDGQGPLCIMEQVGEGRRVLPAELLHKLENV